YAEMPVYQLILFVLFAAAAALVSEIIVGIAAMHSGWFPAFADLGYDFKTGAILRSGKSVEEELFGRRLQLKSAAIGFGVAIAMVTLFHDSFFQQDLVPPVNHVYA